MFFFEYGHQSFCQLPSDSHPHSMWVGMAWWEMAGAELLSDTPLSHGQTALEIATQWYHPTGDHFQKLPDIKILNLKVSLGNAMGVTTLGLNQSFATSCDLVATFLLWASIFRCTGWKGWTRCSSRYSQLYGSPHSFRKTIPQISMTRLLLHTGLFGTIIQSLAFDFSETHQWQQISHLRDGIFHPSLPTALTALHSHTCISHILILVPLTTS